MLFFNGASDNRRLHKIHFEHFDKNDFFRGAVTHWLPNSLTDSCLVNLIDVTLACEDANLKLVDVVTFADVDAEDNVANSLLQIWEPTFWS